MYKRLTIVIHYSMSRSSTWDIGSLRLSGIHRASFTLTRNTRYLEFAASFTSDGNLGVWVPCAAHVWIYTCCLSYVYKRREMIDMLDWGSMSYMTWTTEEEFLLLCNVAILVGKFVRLECFTSYTVLIVKRRMYWYPFDSAREIFLIPFWMS